jgi:hypothetical protein
MSNWLDQKDFDIIAYKLAGVWLDVRYNKGSPELFDEAMELMISVHRNSHPRDTLLGDQWKVLLPKIDSFLGKIKISPGLRSPLMVRLSGLPFRYNPDGSPAEKPKGLFRKFFSTSSHPDPTFRPDICEKNLARYYVVLQMK